MKLNPAVLFTGLAVGAVALAVAANAGTAMYAEDNCQRIVIKNLDALAEWLTDEANQPKVAAAIEQSGATTQGEKYEAAIYAMFADLLPAECPIPLPDDTVLYSVENDASTTFGDFRDGLAEQFVEIVNAAAAGRAAGIGRGFHGMFRRYP